MQQEKMLNNNNFHTGKLFVVATPIGNLKDITLRALDALKDADIIACEDTRITRRLLLEYNISTQVISYHQHSKLKRINEIIDFLTAGKNVALVSDAGTPAISDPGGKLVEQILQAGIRVVPLPGPSAVIALLSASGLASDNFEFLGFLPHKKGREKIFKKIAEENKTIVFYESVHRILKTLNSLKEGLDRERQVVVGRELTKHFEEIKRGNIQEIFSYYESNPEKIKGEFVVAIGK